MSSSAASAKRVRYLLVLSLTFLAKRDHSSPATARLSCSKASSRSKEERDRTSSREISRTCLALFATSCSWSMYLSPPRVPSRAPVRAKVLKKVLHSSFSAS